MIRTIAIVVFGSALACAAQAMPLAPPLHEPDAMFTQAAMGCGPGMVMVNGACVAVDPVTREPIPETVRAAGILERRPAGRVLPVVGGDTRFDAHLPEAKLAREASNAGSRRLASALS